MPQEIVTIGGRQLRMNPKMATEIRARQAALAEKDRRKEHEMRAEHLGPSTVRSSVHSRAGSGYVRSMSVKDNRAEWEASKKARLHSVFDRL